MLLGCTSVSDRCYDSDGSLFSLRFENSQCSVFVFDPKIRDSVLFEYVIDHPYERIAVTSAPQVGFLRELGKIGNIVAASSPRLLYDLYDKDVIDIGEDTHLDIEKLLLSKADIIFVTWYGTRLRNENLIRKAGIEVVYVLEWKEVQPLLRAKWVEVFGAFVGEYARADSIYRQVSDAYTFLCQTIKDSVWQRCSIVSGTPYAGIWYVPAGGTFMANLFADAQVDYFYSRDDRNVSIPLSTEKAISIFEKADTWIGVEAHNKSEVPMIDDKLVWMEAYKNDRMFNYYKRIRFSGANDYWETGVSHPEYILSDMAKVAHRIYFSDSTYFFMQVAD